MTLTLAALLISYEAQVPILPVSSDGDAVEGSENTQTYRKGGAGQPKAVLSPSHDALLSGADSKAVPVAALSFMEVG